MKYSVFFRSLLTIVLLGFMTQTRAEEKKIVVLSDVHVMAKSLEGTEFWNTTVQNSRKIAECSQPIFDQLVETLKQQKPDLVLITGDLTEGGQLKSHEYVKDKLDELRAAGIKIFVIPGNHDLTGTVDFGEFYKDFGYSEATAQEGLSYVAEPFPGLTLLGINSGTDGKLSEETLNFAITQARSATEKGNQIICMMHHALLPHISYANVLISSSNVADWENVREQLACAGIRVVLSGHFHVSDIAMDLTNDLNRSIYDISTGSTVSYPSDYRVLTYSDYMGKYAGGKLMLKPMVDASLFGKVNILPGLDAMLTYRAQAFYKVDGKSLPMVNDLALSVDYDLMDTLSLYLTGNRLVGGDWYYYAGYRSIKPSVMIGATYRF